MRARGMPHYETCIGMVAVHCPGSTGAGSSISPRTSAGPTLHQRAANQPRQLPRHSPCRPPAPPPALPRSSHVAAVSAARHCHCATLFPSYDTLTGVAHSKAGSVSIRLETACAAGGSRRRFSNSCSSNSTAIGVGCSGWPLLRVNRRLAHVSERLSRAAACSGPLAPATGAAVVRPPAPAVRYPVVRRRRGVGGGARAAEAASGGSGSYDPRVVVVYDLSDQVVDYEQAWGWQRALLAQAAAAADAGARGSAHSLLLLQHPPVYTLGAGSTTDNLRFPPGSPPIPLYRTERGGEVTYHGPGQLVMYPILDLQALKPDLHWYLRQLEQVVIQALDVVSGLQGERLEGLTGVWVGGAKVAAIGVRAKRWVSYHGLALNVVTDLCPFTRIVPCGIADRSVTSVQRLLAERLADEDPFAPPLAALAAAGYAAAGAEGAQGGEDMIPLAEATQEDLRRMLARTGMSPLVVTESSPPPPRGEAAAATSVRPQEPDLDDPFAPADDGGGSPVGSDSTEGSRETRGCLKKPFKTDSTEGGGDGHQGGPGSLEYRGADASQAASTHGSGLRVRSCWDEEELLLLREYSCALLEAFEEVFEVELVRGDPGELERLQPAPAS